MIYNGLASRVTNIRLRVECIDANATVTASAAGRVLGDVRAGQRAYFDVSVSSRGATYRVAVQPFDKVEGGAPVQAP